MATRKPPFPLRSDASLMSGRTTQKMLRSLATLAGPTIWEEMRRLRNAKTFESFIAANAPKLEQADVAFAIRHMGTNRIHSSTALKQVLNQAERLELSPRFLSNCIYGVAAGNLMDHIPVQLVDKLNKADMAKFNPQDLTNTLWAFANRNHQDLSSQTAICQILAGDPTLLKKFNSQDLGNTMWSLARLNTGSDELFAALGNEIKTKRKTFKPQELSNVLWAFATAKPTLPWSHQTCLALQPEINANLTLFKPQEISNIAWALTVLGLDLNMLAKHLVNESTSLSGFTPQAIATVCWAFATTQTKPAKLWSKLEVEIASRPTLMEFHSLSMVLYAFTQIEDPSPALWQHVFKQLTQTNTLQWMSNRDWTTILLSFARVGRMPPKVLLDFSTRNFDNFTQMDIGNFLTAMAILGLADGKVLQRVVDHIKVTKDINMVWSFACMDQLSVLEHLPSALWNMNEDTSKEAAWQVVQINLAYQQHLAVSPNHQPIPLVTSLLEQRLEWATTITNQDNTFDSSHSQLQVLKLVRELVPEAVSEARVAGGLLVDIFLPNTNTIIEVDGPSHFLQDDASQAQQQPTGRTLFKRRVLKRAGYKLVPLALESFVYEPNKLEVIKKLIT
ncbi:hypothetical protein BASA81_007899 [Batrachochytrium salamandrivorans]|nr:hypothetical protein BASA81_007899 [Batrachochytrium salamandrivorans]